MAFNKNNWLKKIMENPKWIGYPMILLLLSGIFILMMTSAYRFFDIINTTIKAGGFIDIEFQYVSAKMITIIDTFILITGLFIFATSIFKFFIGPINQHIGMSIHDVNELKISISKVIVLFLVTYLANLIVDVGDPKIVLYNAISIGIVCIILIWYIIAAKNGKNELKSDKNAQKTTKK